MLKKGSLNLSIQAIVIVVIAFVVLGLGLGFVRNTFKDISGTSSSVQEQIRQQILEDLRTGNKKLSFPATTLNIEKGSSQDIAIGVKNVLNGDLSFKVSILTTKQQGNDLVTEEELRDQVEFFLNEGPYTLGPTDAEAYNIKITAAGDKGTYLVRLVVANVKDLDANDELLDDASPYAEKSFFVNII
jgi:hypothetical protein